MYTLNYTSVTFLEQFLIFIHFFCYCLKCIFLYFMLMCIFVQKRKLVHGSVERGQNFLNWVLF